MLNYLERRKIFEECRLRSKLTEPSSSSFWKILNAPISLWLLSTIAIGIISASVTQYQSCTRDFEKDSLDFRKLSDEIPGRNRLLFRKLAAVPNETEFDDYVDKFASGELFWVYSDYKGKSISELSMTRTLLAKKLDPQWTGHHLTECDIELQEGGTRLLSASCKSSGTTPTIQIENEPRRGWSQNPSATPYKWPHQARGFGQAAQTQYLKHLTENSSKSYLALRIPSAYSDMGEHWEIPNKCTLRKIWAGMLVP